jgi:hypothetical protein
MSADKFIDALIGLFGIGRATLGDWPARALANEYVRVIKEAGGLITGSTGSPDGSFDIVRFRFRGRRMRLCIEEFGEVALWGPKSLVTELTARIADEGLCATACGASSSDS